jgi:hypothetical protein
MGFVKGQFSGHGSLKYKADGKFEGSWLNGKRNGRWSLFSTHGDNDVGLFAKNLLNEQGVYIYVNRSK